MNKFGQQRGFSFIELIIALAITSILMLVFLQSTRGLMEISTRASSAAQNSLNQSVRLGQFQRSVGGFIPSWPERDDEVFVGEPSGFSGLTRTALEAHRPSLVVVEFRLEETVDGTVLIYKTDNAEWRLKEFPASNGRFSYLGADGDWRPSWPPAENPEPGPFDDADYFQTPQLPLAIRLMTQDEVWIAAVESSPRLPVREQDALGE